MAMTPGAGLPGSLEDADRPEVEARRIGREARRDSLEGSLTRGPCVPHLLAPPSRRSPPAGAFLVRVAGRRVRRPGLLARPSAYAIRLINCKSVYQIVELAKRSFMKFTNRVRAASEAEWSASRSCSQAVICRSAAALNARLERTTKPPLPSRSLADAGPAERDDRNTRGESLEDRQRLQLVLVTEGNRKTSIAAKKARFAAPRTGPW